MNHNAVKVECLNMLHLSFVERPAFYHPWLMPLFNVLPATLLPVPFTPFPHLPYLIGNGRSFSACFEVDTRA
jgi:hypothetical protein